MTNGATTLVNPSSERVLRSATKNPLLGPTSGKEEHLHDVALVEAEERLMDEEITSVEDNHEEMSSVEDNMVTAALVESSRSALRNHVHNDDEKGDHTDDGKEGRYGLRKRRRPTGQDLERLEHFQSSKDGGLMRSNAPPTSPRDLDLEGRPAESLQIRKHVGTESMRNKPPPNAKPAETGPSQVSLNPHASAVRSASLRTKQPESKATAPRPNLSKTNPVSVTSVPNPLLHITDTAPMDASKSILAASPSLPPPVVHISHTVPCPLPGPAVDEFSGVHTSSVSTNFIDSNRSNAHSTPALRKSSDALPVSAPTPNVTFAIGDIDDGEKGRRVTLNEQPHLGPRIRGFSIDMDLGLDFADLGSSQNDSVDGRSGRDRAFSFECFAFGINADEPLPPLEQQMSMMQGRPRGDSLIFDPASFQDGGIHEKNALETSFSPAPQPEVPPPPPLKVVRAPQPVPSKPPAKLPTIAEAPRVPPPVVMPPPRIIPTEPVVSSSTATATLLVSPGSSTTLSLELVNKDGRIGIYLPDARRARIARFHAKRAKRIWRKRIKYDCRKKLADSRPRIKGRFVKRTDMDDE